MKYFLSFNAGLCGAAALVACIAPSASASFTGFASFTYIAANGNRVVDIVATAPANTRITSVFDAYVSGTFIQDSTISNGGFKPDGIYDTRSNTTDSFMCIGAYDGTSQGGQFFGSSRTQGGGFWWPGGGWDSASNTVNVLGSGVRWDMPSASFGDSRTESLSNFTGTRVDSAFSVEATHGVWVAHLVMDATQTSLIFNATVAGIKANGGGFQGSFGPFEAVPAPGAIALLGLAGLAGRRRR